jgi:ribonuclease T1
VVASGHDAGFAVSRTSNSRWRGAGARLLVLVCALLLCAAAPARDARVAEVELAALPREARETLALIQSGGPMPYRKDGATFGNREQRLPLRERGYYREYTVPTPGARDRGARRIVAGGGPRGDVRTSGEYYYTDDHYASFRRVRMH